MSLELVGGAVSERAAADSDEVARKPAAGTLKVLIVVGHPRRQSLCQALASAYGSGARRAGADVRELRLADLRFDPNVHSFDPSAQVVEKDIARGRALITWADHVVFVYPTWWGTIPAVLKGLRASWIGCWPRGSPFPRTSAASRRFFVAGRRSC